MQQKVLLNANQIDIIINRLVCQLIENHHDFSNTVLIGLQPRGIYLLEKLLNVFSKNHPDKKITSGNLDYSFFRDDFRRNEKIIKVKPSNIDISIIFWLGTLNFIFTLELNGFGYNFEISKL